MITKEEIQKHLKNAEACLVDYQKKITPVGRLLCKVLREQRGWTATWQLGWHEEGVDHLHIFVKGACCFNAVSVAEKELIRDYALNSEEISFGLSPNALGATSCKKHLEDTGELE